VSIISSSNIDTKEMVQAKYVEGMQRKYEKHRVLKEIGTIKIQESRYKITFI
jgi:hypothetical protein